MSVMSRISVSVAELIEGMSDGVIDLDDAIVSLCNEYGMSAATAEMFIDDLFEVTADA